MSLAAGALAAVGLLAPGPAIAARIEVRPGAIVRWRGDGIEACMVKERSWAPLDDACYYPVDLLQPKGRLELGRRRAGRSEKAVVRVTAYAYPVQRLELPRSMVELSDEDLARVRREGREIARLWDRSGPPRFRVPLRPPLDPLPEGGRFGARRIINGSPRSPHSGADYEAPEGTPVLAAAAGVVVLVAEHFFGGRSVFLDHGDGLITAYMHLSRTDVTEGQGLRQGERVGAVGESGRATGPHLHFGVRWQGARVDPSLLLAPEEMVELP